MLARFLRSRSRVPRRCRSARARAGPEMGRRRPPRPEAPRAPSRRSRSSRRGPSRPRDRRRGAAPGSPRARAGGRARHARLAPGSRRRPARRTASRTRRACSGGRSRSPASAPARPPPPRPCGGQRVSAKLAGSGSSRFHAPSQRSAHHGASCGSSSAISSQVRSPRWGTGETSLRPSGTSPGPTGSSAKGNSVTAGERVQHARLVVAAELVLRLSSRVRHAADANPSRRSCRGVTP